jgi:hypothetical protein
VDRVRASQQRSIVDAVRAALEQLDTFHRVS